MSQSPYQPPTSYSQPVGYDDFQDPLKPARRAGILMYVLGGLTLLSSFCCVGIGVTLVRQPQLFSEMPTARQVSPGEVFGESAVALAVAIVLLVLGNFVRRGSKGAIVLTLVLSSLLLILLLLGTIGALPTLLAIGRPEAMVGACIMVVPVVVLIWLIVWLVQGMRAADRAMAQGYAMQYWQYAQQQAYAQQMMQQPQQQQQPPPPPPQ
jgi:hypothetical protein